MQSFGKYISKYLLIFIGVLCAMVILNVVIYVTMFWGVVYNFNNAPPGRVLTETVNAFIVQDGVHELNMEQKNTLDELDVWGMIIDPSGTVAWSYRLPDEVPTTYSIIDIANFTRGFIADYPVFTRAIDDSLLVLGFPQDSFTKILSNALPLEMVRRIPAFLVLFVVSNFILLFAAYTVSKWKILKNINPIMDGVDKLSKGQHVSIQTKGELSEISQRINTASEFLVKKDVARSNWISGVSHDIRTPLSMILGYADRIARNSEAAPNIQEQAIVIRKESIKIKELVSDMNLASKLEYDMQPINITEFDIPKLLRGVVADFINDELSEKYSVDFNLEVPQYKIMGDSGLIGRAIVNLLNNCVKHNPDGCNIKIALSGSKDGAHVVVSDNGVGVSQEKLQNIIYAPHYINDKNSTHEQQHGLGLHLVRNIILAHQGVMRIESDKGTSFSVEITFPKH